MISGLTEFLRIQLREHAEITFRSRTSIVRKLLVFRLLKPLQTERSAEPAGSMTRFSLRDEVDGESLECDQVPAIIPAPQAQVAELADALG